MLAQTISLFVSFFIYLFLPKVLGTEQFAYWQLFAFYITYAGFFHFGVADGIYLKVGGKHAFQLNKRLLASMLRMLVVIDSLVAVVILVASVFFVNESGRFYAISRTAVYLILYNVFLYCGFILQATNDTKRYSISVIIAKIGMILMAFLMVISNCFDYRFVIDMYVLTQLLATLYCIVKTKRIIFAKWAGLKTTVRAFIAYAKIGIVLMIANISSNLILGGSKFIIDAVWGIQEFGTFAFAISLANYSMQFVTQVSMVLFPALRQGSKENLLHNYKKLNKILYTLLPSVLLLYIPIKFILSTWLPEYAKSFEYLIFCLPLCLYDGKMNLLCATYLKVLRKESALLRINAVAMGFSFVLCLVSVLVFKSILAVFLTLLIVIALRSIITQRYLANQMNQKMGFFFVVEAILVVTFIVSMEYLSLFAAGLCYLISYFLYLILYHVNLRIDYRHPSV